MTPALFPEMDNTFLHSVQRSGHDHGDHTGPNRAASTRSLLLLRAYKVSSMSQKNDALFLIFDPSVLPQSSVLLVVYPQKQRSGQFISQFSSPSQIQAVSASGTFIHRGRILLDSHHGCSPHSSVCPPRSVVFSGLNRAQSLALLLRQLRVPHVHDEDEAVAVCVLPDLVLKGVVKDEHFTFLPVPGRHKRKRTNQPHLLHIMGMIQFQLYFIQDRPEQNLYFDALDD